MSRRLILLRQRALRAVETALQSGWIGADTARTLTRWARGRRDYSRRCRSDVDHFWHTWINARQDARRERGEEWESDLYEFKGMLEELRRLPIWFRRERLGTLPTVHQQCSMSQPEQIVANRLVCALGVETAACPILTDLAAKFADAQRDRLKRWGQVTLQPEHLDELKAQVCCWHIFTSAVRDAYAFDTSEGYVQDASDRLYWSNLYESLAAAEEGAEP